MAITVTQLGTAVFNTTAGNKTLVATPTLGDIIVVIGACSASTSHLIGISDNNTDGHGAAGFYNVIQSVLKNTSADPMAAWIRSDAIQKAVSTTWTSTQTSSTGGGLAVFAIRGATISGPALIRNSGGQSNQTATAAPAPALGAAALTTNAAMTAVFDANSSGPSLTVPTGWAASDVNLGYTVTANGLQITHINSGFTGSTVTFNSTDASGTWCSLAFELRSDAGQTSIFPPRGSGAIDIELDNTPKLQAIKRAAYYMQNWQKRKSGLIAPEPGILVPA